MVPPLVVSTLNYTLGSYLASQGKKNLPSSQMLPIVLIRPQPLLGPTLFPAILRLTFSLSACPVVASSLPHGGLGPSQSRPRSP